jgi:glycine hydroxymethyltransferase
MTNNIIQDWNTASDITVAVGADHGGFEKKIELIKHLENRGCAVVDAGAFCQDDSDDYPEFACQVAKMIARGDVDCGILICRSGLGMSMAANRFHCVRAALAETTEKARLSRSHNAANVLVTGGDGMSDEDFYTVVDTWLNTPFSDEERHARRIAQIDALGADDIGAVRGSDPEVADILEREIDRQSHCIELIASENFASAAVRAASGSVMTNKYAEGYPGKRYYDGCEYVDEAEALAIERCCKLFGAEAANVQPHSGSQANMAAYFALLEPGDKVLAMSLDHGGHLTHGLKVNFSGRFYDFQGYGVSRETEMLDYDDIQGMAEQQKPRMIVAGASAYPRIIDFKRLREIADSIGAYLVVDMAHIAGLVAAGLHPSPVPYADIVTSTTHKTLRGPRGGLILCREKYIKKVNSQIFPGIQGGPLMHVIAAKAVCFHEAMQPGFKDYQKQVVHNAAFLAKELESRGFRIVSGGTDNHLMLLDMRPKNTTGKAAATALDEAGITVNKNLIPFDPEKPMVTSGLRIGTPAVTTRGMKEPEMTRIADWIDKVVANIDDDSVHSAVRDEIREFMKNFPLPAVICSR